MASVRFGFHMNIGDGLSGVPARAKELECRTIQIFSRNPRGWGNEPLDPEETRLFLNGMKEAGIAPLVVHMPYLPNPASPDREKYKKSLDSLAEELDRAEILNAPYVNIHIGKAMGASGNDALRRTAQSVTEALRRSSSKSMILLENTAGQGSEIGHSFEQIRAILDMVKEEKRVGVCLDTAHLFAAGYDLRDEQKADSVFAGFGRIVGLDRLHCIHFNDSRAPFGSRVDRHEHIGKGEIGKRGLRAVLRCRLIRHLPFILETPKKTPRDDLMNLRTVKRLLKD